MISAQKTRALLVWALGSTLLVAGFGVSVSAQDTVPETQGELKDFRLDTPAPKEKAPEPAPPPVVETPKPKVEAPAPAPQPKAQERTPQKPASKTEAKPAEPAATTAAIPIADEVASGTAPSDAVPAIAAPAAEADAEQASDTTVETESVTAPSSFDAAQYWPVGAGLLGLLAVLAGLFAWQRRRGTALASDEAAEYPAEPIQIADSDDDHVEEIQLPADLPAPVAASQPVRSSKAATTTVRRMLTASFEPAEARLSLTNLTVTGCLRMRFESPDPLETLQMRSQVISACEGQQAMIDAFHADATAGQIDSLGPVQPGEEIVLTLELQVPREGLQAFDWRERRFIAPILLLNIGSDNPDVAPVIINCLVGQEGSAESTKMRPLAIDRGPRRYGDLRFQPLAA
jgi:outer membrane biosynthesis protein TonB